MYITQTFNSQDSPYLALLGELWDIYCEYFRERYNGNTLYNDNLPSVTSGIISSLPTCTQTLCQTSIDTNELEFV